MTDSDYKALELLELAVRRVMDTARTTQVELWFRSLAEELKALREMPR